MLGRIGLVFLTLFMLTGAGCDGSDGRIGTTGEQGVAGVAGVAGVDGIDGRPGVSGKSVLMNYDYAHLTGEAREGGSYAFLLDTEDEMSGTHLWTDLTRQAAPGEEYIISALLMNDIDADGVDRHDYLETIQPGHIVTLWFGHRRWVDYHLQGVETLDGRHKFNMAYLGSDDVDGDEDLSPNPDSVVQIQWSRAQDGEDGDQGVAGAEGAQGIMGLIGEIGEQGIQGIQGIMGFGVDGVDGDDGIDGAPGAQGPQGNQGIAGIDGVEGRPGTAGKSVLLNYDEGAPILEGTFAGSYSILMIGDNSLSGTTTWSEFPAAPGLIFNDVDADGIDRHDYLETIQPGHVVTLWLSQRKWVDWRVETALDLGDGRHLFGIAYAARDEADGTEDLDNVDDVQFHWSRAEDGDQGVAGTDGVQGDIGDTGADGTQGDPGIQGIQGFPGSQGIPGVEGPTGPAGPAGLDGLDGAGAAELADLWLEIDNNYSNIRLNYRDLKRIPFQETFSFNPHFKDLRVAADTNQITVWASIGDRFAGDAPNIFEINFAIRNREAVDFLNMADNAAWALRIVLRGEEPQPGNTTLQEGSFSPGNHFYTVNLPTSPGDWPLEDTPITVAYFALLEGEGFLMTIPMFWFENHMKGFIFPAVYVDGLIFQDDRLAIKGYYDHDEGFGQLPVSFPTADPDISDYRLYHSIHVVPAQ